MCVKVHPFQWNLNSLWHGRASPGTVPTLLGETETSSLFVRGRPVGRPRNSWIGLETARDRLRPMRNGGAAPTMTGSRYEIAIDARRAPIAKRKDQSPLPANARSYFL